MSDSDQLARFTAGIAQFLWSPPWSCVKILSHGMLGAAALPPSCHVDKGSQCITDEHGVYRFAVRS